MYLNETLLALDEEARKRCELQNAVIDGYFEQVLGYKVLDCSGGA